MGDSDRRTPLHLAVVSNHASSVRALIEECGANVHARDLFGAPPRGTWQWYWRRVRLWAPNQRSSQRNHTMSCSAYKIGGSAYNRSSWSVEKIEGESLGRHNRLANPSHSQVSATIAIMQSYLGWILLHSAIGNTKLHLLSSMYANFVRNGHYAEPFVLRAWNHLCLLVVSFDILS